MGTNFDGLKQL